MFMRKQQVVILFATLVFVMGSLFSVSAAESVSSSEPYITMEFDKGTPKVGDIITATVKVNNITNLAGFQVNIKYDPKVLEAVNPETKKPFTNSTPLGAGTLINNPDYSIIPLAANAVEKGILSFGKSYVDLNPYKEANKPESTGSIAVVGFKVLKNAAIKVSFVKTDATPMAVNGTVLFDWDGKQIKTGYKVIQPKAINGVIKLTINSSNIVSGSETVKIDAPPVVKNGRTLLPIRAVLEAMGGTISWDAADKRVELELDGKVMKLWIDKTNTEVDGESKTTDVAPQIISGRTMLPLRFVTENLGATVDWDNKTKTATVTF